MIFLINDARSVGYSYGKQEPEPYFISHTKINEKWIIGLKSKGKTRNLLEQNIGKYLSDLGIGKEFLNKTQKALKIKKIIICT